MTSSKRDTQSSLTGAGEVLLALHKAIDACRLYGPGHAARLPFLGALHRRLSLHLAEFGPLELEVGSSHLLIAGSALQSTARFEEGLTRALFLDQVRRLVFLPGLSSQELTLFVEIWATSLDPNGDEAHTFTTRCWEAELRSVRLVSEKLFSAGAEEREAAEAMTQALLDERLVGRPPPAHLSAEELNLVEAETGLRPAHPSSLDWKGVLDVPEQALQSLAGDVALRPERPVAAAAGALARLASLADEQELATVKDVVRRVLTDLVRAGRLDEMEATLRRIVEAARPGRGALALETWAPEVLESLDAPAIRSALLEHLAKAETCEAAAAVLRYSRPAAAASLLDVLPTLTPKSRQALAAALTELFPRGVEIEARLGRYDSETTLALLAIARCVPSHEALGVWRRALGHPDRRVRQEALSALRTEDAAACATQLLPLLQDADGEVRRRTLALLLRAKLPLAAAALVHRLQAADLEDSERKTIVLALGRLGGVDAVIALRNEFRSQRDNDLKAVCALALAQAGDEYSRPLLKSTAERRLSPAPLRQACEEALRRLDARRTEEEAP